MKIKLLAFLCLYVGIIQVNAQSNLIVNLNNSSFKSAAVSDVRKITFTDADMNVNYKNGNVENYLLSNINKLYFGTISAVNEIVETLNLLSIYPNPTTDFLILKNLTSSSTTIAIFSFDGTLIKSEMLNNIDSQIDVRCLAKGFYLLKVNNQTLKFIKK